MGYVKEQNEAAGIHEFGLPSGSVITFNCKNQHSVEPGRGRWSLNLWQCADKFQAAYQQFVTQHGQAGGAVPHRPEGRDLILPKPLHLTATQRQQLNAPAVKRVISLAEFNNRSKPQPATRTVQSAIAIAPQALTTEETQTAKTAPENLNVAGNRESKCPGLEEHVETVLKVTLAEIVRVRTELEVNQPTTKNGDTMKIDHTTPIVIACDGACSGNPGPGGYGTIVQYPNGTEAVIVGNALETTNNRMELQGLIEGLKAVYSNSEAAMTFSQNPVHVLTDSDLTIKCAEGTWKRKANADLWREYEQLPSSRKLTFEWVRGHNGHALNERCDKLAVEQSQLAKQGKVSEPATVIQPTAPQAKPQSQSSPPPSRYPTYLSLVNNNLQQHATWGECEAVVKGVSGAKYKKVKDDFERTETLKQWGVPEPTPVRYLIYADREGCPQSDATDVQTQTCALTQKAIQEAQKRGYRHIEIIVATLNDDPVNRECLQPLVVAAQTGVSKAKLSSAVAGNPTFQADVYESPDGALDLLDLEGNPDNRLILISNGKGLGTQQMVQQAESLGVKVVGYNPEKQEYLGAPPQPAATIKPNRSSRDSER